MLAKTQPEIERALDLVRDVIAGKLELKLSPEKTKIVTFAGGGFDFLGFHLSHNGVTMRKKSAERLAEKIKMMTIRSHNFSDDAIQEINRVMRGVANYYATDFSTVKTQFFKFDQTLRRRLRCMKEKRISAAQNQRISNRFLQRKGLLSLYAMAV